ncbi:metal-dependent hydrolase [Alcanivorax sediminis]|uniref:Metal-dependent hydrolase n=1 Tax=Alcanivorax sediminis TaxID=2663008 RepID=A0A6N7LV36_9GAMM|nr:metal-dependent hydrolase [Alcanivorax sediminis]MQX54222.1 metal-dependent hydrolase [Alcanivorax sediminis]
MTIQVDPIRRNLRFGLPKDKAISWNPAGLHVTQFFNTLSLFFPAGERFFIQSVRNYRQEIVGDDLKEQISAFIGQEGFHTREHEEYNDALVAAGMPVEAMDRVVVELLELVKKAPRSFQLAATVALEHLTAVLGDVLLRNDSLLKEVEPHFSAVWRWHAIEETEHKAVCFDAYEQVLGKGIKAYSLRVGAFVIANLLFWSLYVPFYTVMVAKGGGLLNLKGWGKVLNLTLGRPGVLRRALPDWLDFFRPGFHPWMHDNRHFLDLADALVEEVANFDVNQAKAA